jgi:hypothetical protein
MQDTRETIGKLVRLMHEKGVTAVVAGGAARDIFNGHPVKDIDVFVLGGWNMEKFSEQVFGHIPQGPLGDPTTPWVLVGGSEYIPLFRARGVMSVCEMPWEGEMLNFIFMEAGVLRAEVVNNFDLVSNQAWFNYSPGMDLVTLETTAGFLADHHLEQMTVNHCVSVEDAKRTWKRHQRLSAEKYLGYTLVIPAEFAEMFTEVYA